MMAKCSVVIQTAPTAKKKTYETGPKYSVIGTSNLEFEGTNQTSVSEQQKHV
jgi:hypothetical protein